MLIPRILLVTVMFLTVTSLNGDRDTEKWSVHFQGLPVASNSISLIEGDMMNLTCFGSTGKTLEALWDIRDRPESVRETISPIGLLSPLGILDNPFIENVTRSYTGNFHCDEAADATDHPRVIHVDVLYPPSYPKITSGTENMPDINLNCSTDSNPPATYTWKIDHKISAEPNGYGPLITIYDVTEETTVYCIVQNTMVPTHGKVVKTIQVAKHVIKLQTIKESVDITNNGGLVAAAVTGWVLVALFLIGLGILVVWIKWGGTGGNRRPTGGRKNIPNKQRSVMFTSDEYSSDQKVKSKNKPDAVDKGKDADEIKPIPPERPSHTLPTDKQPLPANMEVESPEMNEGTATDTDDHYEDLDHTAIEAIEERYNDIEESEIQKKRETLSTDGYEKPIAIHITKQVAQRETIAHLRAKITKENGKCSGNGIVNV